MTYTNQLLLFLTFAANEVSASAGDRSIFYLSCVERCKRENCTKSLLDIKSQTNWHFKERSKERIVDKVLRWNCQDECNYDCMFATVAAFAERGFEVPQFFGKWPFIRKFGMQEPASVVFSVLNFWAHLRGLRKFRKNISRTAPFYYMWLSFGLISLNAWLWSTVFHTRDTDLTELLDYGCAYSMVISSFYCMACRIALNHRPTWLKGLLGATLLLFFAKHFAYLAVVRGYDYNMKVNIATGITAGVGWIVWCLNQRTKRPYVWKIFAFVLLSALSLALEVLDFPPYWWIFDAHALWHLSTAPLVFLFYSFIIDDSRALHEEARKDKKKLP